MAWIEYDKYIHSIAWLYLRNKRLAIDGLKCARCGRPAKDVHHLRYPSVLGTERMEDLISLCRECHSLEHNIMPERGGVTFKSFCSSVAIVLKDNQSNKSKIDDIANNCNNEVIKRNMQDAVNRIHREICKELK